MVPWFDMSLHRGVQIPSGSPEPTETPSSGQSTFFGDPEPEIFLAGRLKGPARSTIDGYPVSEFQPPKFELINAQCGTF
jgi:hypothetical protein